MGSQIDVYEAETRLSQLIDAALAGEDVVIARGGRPLVRLVPHRHAQSPRVPGAWRGRVTIAPDFDDLPPDLAGAFRGQS